MTQYRNVSGHDRYLMVTPAKALLVRSGETTEIDDPGLITGLVGQESLWEPVKDRPRRQTKQEEE